MAKVKISRGSIYLFVVSLSRESLTLIYISILYINYRSRRNQVNKDRNRCHTLDLWSYASVKRLVFRNIENVLSAIKAIYNYNKYNLIHTQVVVHLPSTYLTLSTYKK